MFLISYFSLLFCIPAFIVHPANGQVVTNKRLPSKELKQVREKPNHSERPAQLDWASHN
jgi:hypothetical protein